MTYTIRTTERFEKEFKKLDKATQRLIGTWIEKNLASNENPKEKGKGLTANRIGQWRYRVGDYRIICKIEDEILVITTISVGHRKNIYKEK